MKLRRRYLIVLSGIVLLSIIIEFAYYMNSYKRVEPIRQISLICYGSDPSRWESLKQGAELYAEGMNAEVTLITMSSEDDAREQISLIAREIKNGADALLIAACDSNLIGDYMSSGDIGIPYAFVENGIVTSDNASEYDAICADDTLMGEALAEVIRNNEKEWIKVAVIADHTEREGVRRRLDALLNPQEKYAEEVVLWERNEQEKNKKAQFFLQRELTEEAVDAVIALDNSSMEELLDATLNLNKSIKIYGIAESSKSVYYLDEGLIKSLVFQDEFSIGYFGARKVLGAIDKKSNVNDDSIRFEIVDHANMHSEDNQKLLFPHIR